LSSGTARGRPRRHDPALVTPAAANVSWDGPGLFARLLSHVRVISGLNLDAQCNAFDMVIIELTLDASMNWLFGDGQLLCMFRFWIQCNVLLLS
jgi:hypothetical protein